MCITVNIHSRQLHIGSLPSTFPHLQGLWTNLPCRLLARDGRLASSTANRHFNNSTCNLYCSTQPQQTLLLHLCSHFLQLHGIPSATTSTLSQLLSGHASSTLQYSASQPQQTPYTADYNLFNFVVCFFSSVQHTVFNPHVDLTSLHYRTQLLYSRNVSKVYISTLLVSPGGTMIRSGWGGKS